MAMIPAMTGERPHLAADPASLAAWQTRRYDALRRHADAPTELVDELPDEPLDDPDGARYIIDRHRTNQERLVRTGT